MLGIFRSLRHRAFALLWSGRTISTLGDRLFIVALAWWVLEETHSAAAMGTILICVTMPMLVFLLMGGVLVDRLPRLRLMLISDLVRGLIMTLLAVLAAFDALDIWHVYGLSLIFGFVEAFFQPAYRAVMPEIVPKDDLPSANSLTGLSSELSGIAGPAIGAATVALVGTPFAFALNGLSFFVAGICLLPILRADAHPRPAAPPEHFLTDLRAGLGAVLALPWLWVTIVVAGLSNITYGGPMEVGLPFLIKDHLKADVGVLGLFYSLMSVGAIVGAVWLGSYHTIRHRGLKLYISWGLVGVLLLLIGLPISIPGFLAIAFGIGVCNAMLHLIWSNLLQERVPRHLLGRVSSVDYFGSYVLLPVGYAIGGWAVEQAGPAPVFLVCGISTALLIGSGLLHPQVRRLD